MRTTTRLRIKSSALTAVLLGVCVGVTGCAGTPQTATQTAAQPMAPVAPVVSVSATPTCEASCAEVPQADHTGVAVMVLTPAAVDAAKKAATEVMGAYVAKGKTKKEWFASLAPLLTTSFAQEAQYIEPSRLPVARLVSGPKVTTGVSTGYQVRASFATNAGDWVVVLTRASGNSSWLAANILPATEANS